jgi:hypothetical protein
MSAPVSSRGGKQEGPRINQATTRINQASGKEGRIELVCGRRIRTGTSEQAEPKLTGRHAEKGGGAAQEGAHLYMSAPVSSRGGGAAQDERRAGGKEHEHSCT